ncbi:MAG TPA: hypothetical protein PK593_00075 [Thermomicrobiales bacterium]|nr:hypothetical protein [Thermomicrobiales bacterium]HQZ90495.1 hypothetical protein [Thermomicrobiales bacterium]HRA32553.1 hypothetical protein [Thermomicrobiales bacterium]
MTAETVTVAVRPATLADLRAELLRAEWEKAQAAAAWKHAAREAWLARRQYRAALDERRQTTIDASIGGAS